MRLHILKWSDEAHGYLEVGDTDNYMVLINPKERRFPKGILKPVITELDYDHPYHDLITEPDNLKDRESSDDEEDDETADEFIDADDIDEVLEDNEELVKLVGDLVSEDLGICPKTVKDVLISELRVIAAWGDRIDHTRPNTEEGNQLGKEILETISNMTGLKYRTIRKIMKSADKYEDLAESIIKPGKDERTPHHHKKSHHEEPQR